MARVLGPSDNPFREVNPINAQRRKELLNAKRSRYDEIEQFMNERYRRLQEERRQELEGR